MGQRRVTERICGAPFSYSPLILQASIGSSTLRSPWGFCEISTIACKCDLHVGGVGFSPTHLCYPQAPINHGEQMLPPWQGASLWSVRLKPMPCCLYRRFLAENWPLLVQACRISQAWCSCQTRACLSQGHSWVHLLQVLLQQGHPQPMSRPPGKISMEETPQPFCRVQ